MYLVKTPFLLKWYYSALTWHMSRRAKIVYLTFDDGPVPNVTDFVLNTLAAHQITATFFCIGDNIRKHPSTFERLLNEGHRIGNHTFNHLNGWKTDDNIYLDNIQKCQELTKSNLFRPPYGRIKKSQIRKLKNQSSSPIQNIKISMWDVLSADFDIQINGEKCYLNVVNNVQNGSIIVFHDSLKAQERLMYALPKVINYLKKEGYQFGIL